LNNAKITIDDRITRAAILLLGKPISAHFISPAQSTITWILRDKENIELDYMHFTLPILLNVEKVFQRIRNIKYRYIMPESIFPEETDTYDLYVIREALHNCIAHQDYTMGGKITVVEFPDKLIFSNEGKFIPTSIDHVFTRNSPDRYYRNQFLADAMVNLNMIDTIGSGIKRMFMKQKDKFFPMPDYQIDEDKVVAEISGKILDLNFARILAQEPKLSLIDIFLLDKVQKKKTLLPSEILDLKNIKLIEGRKPNFHISGSVAKTINQKTEYIKQKGIDDAYRKKIIRDYLKQFEKGKRRDFDKLLLTKLPEILTHQQKQHKIKNILQAMKNKGEIVLSENQEWRLK
jgi:ATP-dependent DNA helicase RecG